MIPCQTIYYRVVNNGVVGYRGYGVYKVDKTRSKEVLSPIFNKFNNKLLVKYNDANSFKIDRIDFEMYIHQRGFQIDFKSSKGKHIYVLITDHVDYEKINNMFGNKFTVDLFHDMVDLNNDGKYIIKMKLHGELIKEIKKELV